MLYIWVRRRLFYCCNVFLLEFVSCVCRNGQAVPVNAFLMLQGRSRRAVTVRSVSWSISKGSGRLCLWWRSCWQRIYICFQILQSCLWSHQPDVWSKKQDSPAAWRCRSPASQLWSDTQFHHLKGYTLWPGNRSLFHQVHWHDPEHHLRRGYRVCLLF